MHARRQSQGLVCRQFKERLDRCWRCSRFGLDCTCSAFAISFTIRPKVCGDGAQSTLTGICRRLASRFRHILYGSRKQSEGGSL